MVIEEERLNRQKHTREFPSLALDEAFDPDRATALADIDVITTPWDMRRLRLTVLKAIFGRLPGKPQPAACPPLRRPRTAASCS